eukprot:696853-Prymnesium_polylepis.1
MPPQAAPPPSKPKATTLIITVATRSEMNSRLVCHSGACASYIVVTDTVLYPAYIGMIVHRSQSTDLT